MSSWQQLSDPAIRAFIATHEGDDVAALALQAFPETWPRALILDQIRARQKARRKMPAWVERNDIIFPLPGVIEQASSAATARFKASLVRGDVFADLTAGAGVDTVAFAQNFSSGYALESDSHSAALLAHNLPLLATTPIRVMNERAEAALAGLPPLDLVYLDPQRRAGQKRGLIALEDTSPDVTALLPALRAKAKTVLLKTSPALDIDRAIEELGGAAAVHIVEWRGECREVLYVMTDSACETAIHAHMIDDDGATLHSLTLTRAQEREARAPSGPPAAFLYEPGPALMKSGAFNLIARRYGLTKLHPHTHLYTADMLLPVFPGRRFVIENIVPAHRKKIAAAVPDTRAHLTLRNFPGRSESLLKSWGLEEGGDVYLFACTLEDGAKAVIVARKPA